MSAWYFTYKTPSDQEGSYRITREHPVDFAVKCNERYTDGPYLITFAVELTEEQYQRIGDKG